MAGHDDGDGRDLARLLRSLRPSARPGEYVVATVDPAAARALVASDALAPDAVVVEDEGVTVVLSRERADRAGVPYGFVAAWITLGVHSSLDAVGLTAAFSTALDRRGISCNVLAGFHHDHLLVPAAHRDRAMDVLRELASG